MQTLGVGIIGLGFIGKVHAYAYRAMPFFYDPSPMRTRLVGVATAHAESARKAAVQGDFEFSTNNLHELIARDNIHIINICSPNLEHTDQLLAAMAAVRLPAVGRSFHSRTNNAYVCSVTAT